MRAIACTLGLENGGKSLHVIWWGMREEMDTVFVSLEAMPIWLNQEERLVNQYVEFQREFWLDKKETVTLYICVDTEYQVYLNGTFVACNQYADYPAHKVYDTIDVSDWLVQGKNVIYVLGYSQGNDCSVHISGTAMLMYALKGETLHVVSDEKTMCRQSDAYQSGEIEVITQQLSYTFCYDARKDAGDAGWENSKIVPVPPTEYRPRPISKLDISNRVNGEIVAQGYFLRRNLAEKTTAAQRMQSDYLSAKRAVEVFETSEYAPLTFRQPLTIKNQNEAYGVYFVLDLKEETAGFFDMELDAAEGTVLEISYGEHLDDLRVRSHIGGRNFAFSYICKQGRQTFTHRMKRIAGRYLEVHISKAETPVTFYSIGMLPTVYPLGFDSGFRCSDRLFNKIYAVSAHTLRLCVHEHYEDCPWREQALYAMDSRNQMLCGYYAFGEYAMPKASLRLLADSQNEDGEISLTAPGKCELIIPTFSLMWVVAVRDYVLYSGDLESITEFLPHAEAIMRLFWGRSAAGLIATPYGKSYWNFYEWADGMDHCSEFCSTVQLQRYDAPLNLFAVLATEAYMELLHWGNAERHILEYAQKTAHLKEQIHKVFWDADKCRYKTYHNGTVHYSELTQALAICTGVADGTTADVLRKELSQQNDMVKTSLSYLFFKYEALLQDVSYADFVFQDIETIWGGMLYRGATSFWETEKGAYDFENAGSLCHGWSAIPIYFFCKYLLGIVPKTPQRTDVSFAPVGGIVSEAEANILRQDSIIHVKTTGATGRIEWISKT